MRVKWAEVERYAEAGINVTARQGETALTASASHDGALVPEFYEAGLDLPSAGEWQFVIDIAGEADSGQAGFTLSVEPAGMNWWLVALMGVGVVVVGWVGVLVWRGQRRDRHR